LDQAQLGDDVNNLLASTPHAKSLESLKPAPPVVRRMSIQDMVLDDIRAGGTGLRKVEPPAPQGFQRVRRASLEHLGVDLDNVLLNVLDGRRKLEKSDSESDRDSGWDSTCTECSTARSSQSRRSHSRGARQKPHD
jgi:hypothetical protein